MTGIKVGESFSIDLGHGDVWEGKVLPPCEDGRGQWYCLTCGESLPHNLAASSHREHKLVWNCFEHGIEVAS